MTDHQPTGSPRTRREKRLARRVWRREHYWPQKHREFRCWVKTGHNFISLGGAAGWSVLECESCGAERIGSCDFFNNRWTSHES